MSTIKAVIFDIDGTLTEDNSWYGLTRDLGGSEALHLATYEGQRSGQIGLDEAKAKLLAMWQQSGRATRDAILELYAGWPIRPEAYSLVRWLKARDYRLCLITGSVNIYAKVVAEKLGIAEYYANADLYFDDLGKLSSFRYDTDQASVKLGQLKQFCVAHHLQPEECVAIGDGNNDIKLFTATGKGILLDGANLADALRGAAWKTVGSLGEVQAIVEAANAG